MGAATGAIIGAAVGSPAAGAAIGGALGGGTGAVVGDKMQGQENLQLEQQLQQKVLKRDFEGAAALQVEIGKLRKSRPNAEDLQRQLKQALSRSDYAGAASISAELEKIEPSSGFRGESSWTTPGDGRGRVKVVNAFKDLWSLGTPIPEFVRLENVRLLSVGKDAEVPSYGKAKGKMGYRGEGKGLSSDGKGKSKGMPRVRAKARTCSLARLCTLVTMQGRRGLRSLSGSRKSRRLLQFWGTA